MFRPLFVVAIAVCANFVHADDGNPLTYEQHIRPIFRAHCFDCHGATDEFKGGLDLRLVRSMTKGGESGAAIVPSVPGESHLLQRIRSGEMPPGEGHLPDDDIRTIERWIAEGARTARPEPESIGPGLGITPEERSFWSFQPISRPGPDVASFDADARVRSEIDALIAKTFPVGVTFAQDADRRTLIKRAYLDLLGLPPSPDEMTSWLTSERDDWYDAMLTELLDSPHYGERWARHWLDVAGYADSEGYTAQDVERPWAWKYRDYVIQSLNADKPFDRFITEQLAGDELAGPINGDLTAEQIELLTATGFLRMAADGTNGGDNSPAARNQVMTDTIKIVGTSLLGLSLQCAQCHDHRYDPIPQTDYYAIRAVFEPALDWNAWKDPNQRRVSLYTQADRDKAAEIEAEAKVIADEKAVKQAEYMKQALEKELLKYEEPMRSQLREAYEAPGDKRTEEQKLLLAQNPSVNISPGVLYQYLPDAAEELKKFDQRISEVRAKKTTEEFLRALVEPPGHAPETKLFHRGDHEQPKQTVMPAALTVAAPDNERPEFPANDPELPTTGRRLAFAKWLTSGQHPLVGRVIVNRVWMHHFGSGLVQTPSDFGKLGVQPSHPELLDWLASEFAEQGWSLKHLHRIIMSSTAYRQSSETALNNEGPAKADAPFVRKQLVRLEAETIRDRMLAVSGQLDRTMFGAPVAIKEDDTGQIVVDGSQTRRSLYIQARRSRPVAMLQAFDAPVMETNCELRPNSTVATQSLILMNGEFTLAQAGLLAERAAKEATPLSAAQVAQLPEIPPPPQSEWSYGFGSYDPEGNRVGSFQKLEHWTGSQWQAGPALPDPEFGWVLLHAQGGHPDNSERSVIRRWTAPSSGTISISGKLSHGSPNGDGVRGRIVSSRAGSAGEWTAFNAGTDTPVSNLNVQAGDTIDFVTDCLTNFTSDSFTWPVTITLAVSEETDRSFVSADAFVGPAASTELQAGRIVRAWELAFCRPPTDDELVLAVQFVAEQSEALRQSGVALPDNRTPARQAMVSLCQSLMSSNEFLYVD